MKKALWLLLFAAAIPAAALVAVAENPDGSIVVTASGESDDATAAWCRVGQEARARGWDALTGSASSTITGVSIRAAQAAGSEDHFYLTSEVLEQCAE